MAIRQHCRCRHCGARRALPKRLSEYIRAPRCNVCNRAELRNDRYMNRRNTRAVRCDCAGYWFPHRRGSLYCHCRKDGTVRIFGDWDFADRNYDPELGWT